MKTLLKSSTILLCLLVSSVQLMGQSHYFNAIDRDNLVIFEKALAKGKDINAQRNSDGYTPLMYSIIKGKKEFTQRLLNENCDLEIKENRGNTALLIAALFNRLDDAKLLLEHGASANVLNDKQFSPVCYLAKQYNSSDSARLRLQKEVMTMLFERGDSILNRPYNPPLVLAAERGNIELVKFLCEAGADLNYKSADNKSAVTQAAQKGRIEVLNYAWEQGADLNYSDSKLDSVDYLLAQYRIMEHLRSTGGNEAVSKYKLEQFYSPLIIAIENNRTEAAKFLIDHGADPEYLTPTSYGPLKSSVVNSNAEVITHILEKTGKLLELSIPIDNDLMASSIIYSENNKAFAALTKKEKYYFTAALAENKYSELGRQGNDIERQKYLLEAIENYRLSYDSYASIEEDYRKKANKLAAQAAASALVSGLLLVSTGILVYGVLGGYTEDYEQLYKIADRYKLQMTVLEGKANMLEKRLQE